MARAISDEELQLRKRARRRLIGAIVLVIAMVVVLPMVLDSEPKPVSQDIDIRIPSPDAGTFTSKIVPVAPGPEAKPAPKPRAAVKPDAVSAADSKAPKAPPPAPAAPAGKSEAAATATEPGTAAAKPAAKPPAPEQTVKKTASTSAGRFVVQVVALADAQKANQMQQQISAAGMQSYTEVVKTDGGNMTRVRVGPFATREAAEKAQQQLKGIGFDGKVVPRK